MYKNVFMCNVCMHNVCMYKNVCIKCIEYVYKCFYPEQGSN